MTPEKESENGRNAELLLDNPIYQESIEAVRNAIIDTWATSPIRDTDGQHELRLMLKLLNDLTSNIRAVAETGKLAKLQIERERGLKERVKGLFAA